MSDDDRTPPADSPEKPKKRGFFSRLFGRGADDASQPEVRPQDAPPDHDQPAEGAPEAAPPAPAAGQEAEAPEVRPDSRAPAAHDQPAEGGRGAVEAETAAGEEAEVPEVRPDTCAPAAPDQPAERGREAAPPAPAAGEEAEAPDVRPDSRAPVDHDQPAEGGREAAPSAPAAGQEAEAPEVRPDTRAPVDHDQPAEGGREAVEAETARRVADDLGEAIEQAAEPAASSPQDDAAAPPAAVSPAGPPPAPESFDTQAPPPPPEGDAAPDERAALDADAEAERAAAIAEAEAPAPAPDEAAATQPQKKGWFARLREGLARSSSKLTEGITGLFTKRRLDDEALEELEDLLITADLGVTTSARLVASLAKERFGKDVTGDEVRAAFAEDIADILRPVAQPLVIDRTLTPHVVLVVGVNGSGKTTTIGKMAKGYRDQGLKVMIAAGDTFRAAAVEQLKVWGDRTGCPVISRDTGADAAGLAYDAYEQARKAGADVLLIDTAGRLQNKAGLMEELRKIIRVLKKLDESAPHSTLLVLDATVGQNAHNQVEVFKDMVAVTGLVMTKLDGTAKGGVVVALADKFGLPVHFIGVGETAEDLRPFKAEDFARGLMGV